MRFTPGARTHWHVHPMGQVLHVTDGTALVVTRDGSVLRARAGDTVVCFPPGEEHWHGATADSFPPPTWPSTRPPTPTALWDEPGDLAGTGDRRGLRTRPGLTTRVRSPLATGHVGERTPRCPRRSAAPEEVVHDPAGARHRLVVVPVLQLLRALPQPAAGARARWGAPRRAGCRRGRRRGTPRWSRRRRPAGRLSPAEPHGTRPPQHGGGVAIGP